MGLAVSDASALLATPHKVLARTSDRQVVGEIAAEAAALGAALIVVGLPLNMDGTEGASAARSRKLARYLKAATGLEVQMRDERLTSEEAKERLREGGADPKEIRERIDAVAAAILLEDFLAELREGKTS